MTLKEQAPNAMYAPTNNEIFFLLLNLTVPLPFSTPAAPTTRVMARPVVARTMRAAPTMRFLLHPILELASRNSTTNHSQNAMVSHFITCKSTSQTTCDGTA